MTSTSMYNTMYRIVESGIFDDMITGKGPIYNGTSRKIEAIKQVRTLAHTLYHESLGDNPMLLKDAKNLIDNRYAKIAGNVLCGKCVNKLESMFHLTFHVTSHDTDLHRCDMCNEVYPHGLSRFRTTQGDVPKF